MGSMNIDKPTAQAGFPTVLSAYFGAVLFEAFLFGLYSILFMISVYVHLWCHKPRQWFLLATSVVMYAIATADIAYTVWLFFRVVLGNEIFTFAHLYPKYSLFVTNTFVAHGLLLYRCVAVWKHNLWLIVAGLFGLFAVTVTGYALEGTSLQLVANGWVYLSLTLVLNLTLTGLTAGKIIFVTREKYHLLPQALKRRSIIAIAILIECGALYTIYLALILGFQKNSAAHAILDSATVQVVGIVPTLMIVQVGLGRTLTYPKNEKEETALQHVIARRPNDDEVLLIQHRPSASMSSYMSYPLTSPRNS